jgi:hypothetical protein
VEKRRIMFIGYNKAEAEIDCEKRDYHSFTEDEIK